MLCSLPHVPGRRLDVTGLVWTNYTMVYTLVLIVEMRSDREMIPRNVDWLMSKEKGRTLVSTRLQEFGQLAACSGRGSSKGLTLLLPFLKALDPRPQQWSQSPLGNGKSQANSAHNSNSVRGLLQGHQLLLQQLPHVM